MDKLAKYFEESGDTLTAFAQKTGVTTRTVRYWLKGEKIPSDPTRVVSATKGFITLDDIFNNHTANQ